MVHASCQGTNCRYLIIGGDVSNLIFYSGVQVRDLKDTLSSSHSDKEYQVRAMEDRLDAMKQKHQDEVEQLRRSATREREQLLREKEGLYDDLNKSIGRQINSELEVKSTMSNRSE